jgi:hypothetical protein
MPGGIQLRTTALTVTGFSGASGQGQKNEWQADPGFHGVFLNE